MKRIYLYGAPGCGKTTLGRKLAEATGRMFTDLDAEIKSRTGRKIADIFVQGGEAAFRKIESDVLRSLAGDGIVALGGGTLLRDENRRFCEESGRVICIDEPSAEELERRIKADGSVRPLGNKAVERREHYASFENRIVRVFELEGSVVLVGKGLLEGFLQAERTVFDATVAKKHGALAAKRMGEVRSGEEYKTVETVMAIWGMFAQAGIGRKDLVAACGGGVTGDLTGFAAATWMRGVDWMNFPTTLLSMVDASTGGKTGCDLAAGKNLVGAFHSPRLVAIDTEMLKTLPEREIASGKAEMIKHEIIGGLEARVGSGVPSAETIAENLGVKVGIVAKDPFERLGERMKLNCGHTIGHAIEAASGYQVSHGEAVAIGCVEEARMAEALGVAKAGFADELAERFATVGLPVRYPDGMNFENLWKLMLNDKKKDGKSVNFALPCGYGDVRIVNRA